MLTAKTPTSSLPVSKPLPDKLWYQTTAKIKQFFCKSTPDPPVSHSSRITKLPQEVVEMILSYLIYNMPSLLACSLTCYSWYIAAVPHLHHTLTIDHRKDPWPCTRHSWPRPLKRSHELGLLPLVKRFQIRLYYLEVEPFSPTWLNRRTMRYFSALTNLQELGIDRLDVSRFMPIIQQCFGHLSPTLQFLALKEPRGSYRQVLYFIGLFPNLQDLKLHHLPQHKGTSMGDMTLIPLSISPLRGRLTLVCFSGKVFVKAMIALFGGLRFRHMDLYEVRCAQLLLEACADTLETLRLYPADDRDKSALPQNFDFSQNKSLRTLETTAVSIDHAEHQRCGATCSLFKTVVSSITPSMPLDFVIIYEEQDLRGMLGCYRCKEAPACFLHSYASYPRSADNTPYRRQIRAICDMYRVRSFRLVLCADVVDYAVDNATEELEWIVERVEEDLGHLPHEPLIVFERRAPRFFEVSGYRASRSVMRLSSAL